MTDRHTIDKWMFVYISNFNIKDIKEFKRINSK